MPSEIHSANKREQGVALVVTVVTLVIATMIGLTALQHTQEESTAGGRARATARTLHAADAGVQFAMGRLAQSPPYLNAFSLTLANGLTVESRTRTQGTPQNIAQVTTGGSSAPEGYAINIGADSGVSNHIYRVSVTATAGSAAAELETSISKPIAEGSSY